MSTPSGWRWRARAATTTTANGSLVVVVRHLAAGSGRRGVLWDAAMAGGAAGTTGQCRVRCRGRRSSGPAARELEQAGYKLLHPPREEPWGQTVARMQSPEGAIIGISYAPVLHDQTDRRSDTKPHRTDLAPGASRVHGSL
jgi:hypothetical protein